jgi:predicted nucleic-acid-binding Zn-ribbon protein
MRSTQTCPECSGKKFAVTKEFAQPIPRTTYGRYTFPAITVEDSSGTQGLGMFEAWICLHCGFTRFYAHDLPHDIEAIIKGHPAQWRVVDATPPEQGPYR